MRLPTDWNDSGVTNVVPPHVLKQHRSGGEPSALNESWRSTTRSPRRSRRATPFVCANSSPRKKTSRPPRNARQTHSRLGEGAAGFAKDRAAQEGRRGVIGAEGEAAAIGDSTEASTARKTADAPGTGPKDEGCSTRWMPSRNHANATMNGCGRSLCAKSSSNAGANNASAGGARRQAAGV